MKILRSGFQPGVSKGLGIFVYEVTGNENESLNFIIETRLTSVLFVLAKTKDSINMIASTEEDSTTYSGTKKVTVALDSDYTQQIIVIGTDGYDDTMSISADTVVADEETN